MLKVMIVVTFGGDGVARSRDKVVFRMLVMFCFLDVTQSLVIWVECVKTH